MGGFDDRKKAEEVRFVRDEELAFKARARRNRLVGLWAAAKLGFSGAAADQYAATVVTADLEKPGDDDVVAKLAADLQPAGIAEHTIRHELAEQMAKALESLRGA